MSLQWHVPEDRDKRFELVRVHLEEPARQNKSIHITQAAFAPEGVGWAYFSDRTVRGMLSPVWLQGVTHTHTQAVRTTDRGSSNSLYALQCLSQRCRINFVLHVCTNSHNRQMIGEHCRCTSFTCCQSSASFKFSCQPTRNTKGVTSVSRARRYSPPSRARRYSPPSWAMVLLTSKLGRVNLKYGRRFLYT